MSPGLSGLLAIRQALLRSHEAITLAQELSHPLSLAEALGLAAMFHQFRREDHAVQERAEALIVLATEPGFSFWAAWGTLLRGWALAMQGQSAKGMAYIRQGLAIYQATGAGLIQPYWLALLAEAYGKERQPTEGLSALVEALALVEQNAERF
jgi:predicted ATPase